MKTIRNKIIFLFAVIWIIISLVWCLMIYSNQKTIENYNEILQRYLLFKEISQFSQDSINALNHYFINPAEEPQNEFLHLSNKLKKRQDKLNSLKNQSNMIMLMNFDNMIKSQLESMELASSFFQKKNDAKATFHFNEAVKTSTYITETTLLLINGELKTYDHFYREIIQQSKQSLMLSFLTLATTSITIFLIFFKFSNDITRPIVQLTNAAREISSGNFEQIIDIQTKDEINFLASTLNQMRVNIKNLIGEIQKKAKVERELQEHKLLLKESELKTLQSQINPHFLFNTLNILAKKAFLENAKETSNLIISVADLLRYNIKSMGDSTTIQKEMKGLEHYLIIQQARFEERVHYTIHVDENCLFFTLPSLTLQPFVENAIIHAIEPFAEGGNIAIRVQKEDLHINIEIVDNGPGIPNDIVQSILNGFPKNEYKGQSTGIGIHNVIRRLQLFYGKNDIVEINSISNQGTRIILRLPIQGGD
ncbi:sensor histidine kinase [Neobacillus notoginsengisoli]|uniref:histidine kinase n=1 Tax=Neobacillus notoginsengisoli TaxID=1578198 RepID=A0A417YIF7_9BACI|nr:sensor histidine kinase [Neobacillus notoginsengisoli]RHW32811.1 sensor histidine kinase [Neobacillus notoginsengisoli]